MSNKESNPIIVKTENITEKKYKAICDLASAVNNISKALSSVSTQITIQNCNIKSAKENAIIIETAD